jgi:hypothetical protein
MVSGCIDTRQTTARAGEKRRELEAAQLEARHSVGVLSILPKAAAMYGRQVEQGLGGDERAALKARIFLRALLGRIDLKRERKGELWAEYAMQPAALLTRISW